MTDDFGTIGGGANNRAGNNDGPPGGTAYGQPITAMPAGTYTFGVSGSRPPGLTLNAATGVLGGTPTTAGLFSFTTSTGGCIGSRSYSRVNIACGTITFNPSGFALPNAQVVARIRHGDKVAGHGKTPPLPDAQRLQNDVLIARSAALHDCFVVTANVADFLRIQPYLKKLEIVAAADYFSL